MYHIITKRKYFASNIIESEMMKFSHYVLELNIAKSNKQKTINNNIRFTRAYEGNTVIMINKFDYIHNNSTFFEKGKFQIW